MEIPNATILLVEDDLNDVLLVQRAMRAAKLANPIQVLEDGEQAIAYLGGQGLYADRQRYPLPVLLVLDLKLPRKSGFDVLAWLRQQSDMRRLPVVVLTSSNQNQDINRAYDLGANSYLVKPVGFSGLMEMVSTLNMYWILLNETPEIGPA